MTGTPMLIAGAGPTGLVLALWLSRAGVPFRLIDEASAPNTASRTMAVQARTLELYRPLGLADAAGLSSHSGRSARASARTRSPSVCRRTATSGC